MSNPEGSRDPSLLFANGDELEDIFHEQSFDINPENLKILEVIPTGLYSTIYNGEIKKGNNRLEVVVKGASIQENGLQQRMILDELQVLTEIKKHPNVLAMIGVVPKTQNSVSLVLERCESLPEFLNRSREHFRCRDPDLDEEYSGFVLTPNNNEPSLIKNDELLYISDLLSMAYQIANGMQYLANFKYVHRQLALRCIYITDDKTIRIGDLGMARKHETSQYYRIVNKDMPLPFHWMAPETFENHKFTEKSDVWSFAVCLWEVFTLGEMPYKSVENVLVYLKRGRRLQKPEYCHQEIYDFMLTCWNMDPAQRPTFTDCVRFLEAYMTKNAPRVLTTIQDQLRSVCEGQRELESWIK